MELANVLTAADFLTAAKPATGNRCGAGPGKARGDHRGGSVAMDVATTCAALGAKKCTASPWKGCGTPRRPARSAAGHRQRGHSPAQCQVTAITGRVGRSPASRGRRRNGARRGCWSRPTPKRCRDGVRLKVEAVITAIGSGRIHPEGVAAAGEVQPRGLILADKKTQATAVRGSTRGRHRPRPGPGGRGGGRRQAAAESIIKSVRR